MSATPFFTARTWADEAAAQQQAAADREVAEGNALFERTFPDVPSARLRSVYGPDATTNDASTHVWDPATGVHYAFRHRKHVWEIVCDRCRTPRCGETMCAHCRAYGLKME